MPSEVHSLIHPEDREQFFTDLEKISSSHSFLDRRPVRMVTPDGRILSMEVQAEPFHDNGGASRINIFWWEKAEGGSGRAALDLEVFQEVAKSFITSTFDPMVLLNTEGRINHVNPPLLELLGYRRFELIGKPAAILLENRSENLKKGMLRFAKWMRTGTMQDVSTYWQSSEGEKVPVTMSGSTVRSENGELIGMLIVARDERQNALLKDLERKNRDLEAAYEELKRVDQMKDDILSLVGHELRAPLANILGYAEFLYEWDSPAEEKNNFARIIYQESQRLSRLVNDILELSRMEAGRMQYYYHRDYVNRVVQAAADSLWADAEKKNLNIKLDLDEDLESMTFDADRIQQVVTNILGNAIKFTDAGKCITVKTRVTEEGALISIADQGPGIDDQDVSKVFNKFEQVDDVKHHSIGAGLGMPIAKQIVEEGHGGRLWFESEGKSAGAGTVFYFTLPDRKDEP
ncbi:MAG: ATP-binding protein [bacterium]